jgi:DNA invertase Pin-like site-specific DNA recombinase
MMSKYRQVQEMAMLGLTLREIARRSNTPEYLVRKWLQQSIPKQQTLKFDGTKD